ncbi:autotransporter outer membrane beta-barrel domain-containing protein [Albimonas sp. CAU 1670]|uniref:autotransporter outer membrane beta-barrel domain-containing protein n=1 Tax=Albimonas sp. CAU 1670 TaxID=3032599 RepID=UPI0023DCB48D|nr:autotransporter outer membrane beta-barrel domain-containing protein [Albimonas sp. CAU 1670]MDF2231248.1 autotransporter outer membrane beta-barrel domain-containing protein [Albimonas sp. CAU 1670]
MSFQIIDTRAVGARPRLRAVLLGSCCAAALGMSGALVATRAAAQLADCPPGRVGPESCTIPADAGVAGAQVLFTGPNATGDDDQDADPAGSYTLTNYNTLGWIPDRGQFAGLAVRLRGGQGADDKDDAGASGAGGEITLDNQSSISVRDLNFAAHGGDDSAAGLWDRGGLVFGLYAASVGGEGRDARDQTFGGGDGGDGGDGGTVDVTNAGRIDFEPASAAQAFGTPRVGAVAILASSTSGSGGERDTTDGEPRGGSAGDAGQVTVTNTGSIRMCDVLSLDCKVGPDPLSDLAAGIYAQSASGHGADPTSSGGDAGAVSVDSVGDILLRTYVDRTGHAYGIFAASQAGYAGITSKSIGVDGGDGGDSGRVDVAHDGRIELRTRDSAPAATPEDEVIDRACLEGAVCQVEAIPYFIYQSAGILAATYGAAGGASKDGISRADGGQGGDAGIDPETGALGTSRIKLADGAQVDVAGNNIMGVALYAQGALGGLGNSTNSNGGRGGDTGDLKVVLGSGASIVTQGANSAGVMIHAKGGSGGGVRTPGGLVDFHGSEAGRGGNAGDVTLVLPTGEDGVAPVISTQYGRSIGIVMQSLAGGGGSADSEYSLFSAGETKGGNSGTAGKVSAAGRFDVRTDGYGSHGLLMQSIAGGGGSLTTDGAGVTADTDEGVVVAGAGGDGTPGGEVVLESDGGRILTRADASAGAVLQSIGGGGGDVIDVGGAAGVATVGGQGGGGGAGGAVTATLHSGTNIQTRGKYSFGLLAHSIGGGGGNGGDVFAIASRVPNVAVGGDGGTTGDGGKVTLEVEAGDEGLRNSIFTQGDNAHGALVQSIGGGGGTGGDARSLSFGVFALTSVAIAGGGSTGGEGGEVDITAEALDVTTWGSHARGLVAHSIGRGGGAGGAATSTDVSVGFGSAVAVGGKGGEGGDAGEVKISLDDVSIATGGDALKDGVSNNHGLVAQSVGGGGGLGGSADALAYAIDLPIPAFDLQVAIAGAAAVGGKGGKGGEGKAVSLDLTDVSIATRGDGGHGILAQSVGGGGGDGGDGSSMAAASLFIDRLKEAIPGEEEPNVKSLKVNTSVSISMGGNGGAGGTGGDVDLSLEGATAIETWGPNSNAILAQSIAKGGGNGGVAGAGTKKFGEGVGVKMAINIGGYGGDGASDAGRMTADLGAETYLRTHGEGARGMVMHGVGGGGGASQTASVSFTSKLTDAVLQKLNGKLKAPRLTVGVGMTGGGGGEGGRIAEANLAGVIETFGADGDGVLLQSVGGGGGLGGNFGGGGAEEDGEKNVIDFGLELQEIKEQIERPWALNVNVGGRGGEGGAGGDFAVAATEVESGDATRFMMPTLDGAVVTHGDYADGVVLQSIGGGGGVGGGAVPHDSIGFLDLSLRIGGTGGAGGKGGQVGFRLGEDAEVLTYGDRAHGVLLQSIGGGGGMGGSASRLVGNLGIDAETEAPEEDGEPQTNEDAAFEELDVASLYDRGDEALPAAAVRLGIGGSGEGGEGANAARAEANGEGGRITTNGAAAFGLTVQSVGGGGGMGGIGTAPLTAAELSLKHLDVDDRTIFVDNFNALFRGAHLDFIAGGDGGRGGNGGEAAAQGAFRIVTNGVRSPGLIVQSVGGGGGVSGIEGARLLRHGADGGQGDAGPVAARLEHGTKINANGYASPGVIVQSVAGGGGTTMSTLAYGSALRRYDPENAEQAALDLLFELTLGSGVETYGAGHAGGATMHLVDDVTTRGDAGYAAIVQSVGVGGGVVVLTPAEIDRAQTTSLSSGVVTMGSASGCLPNIPCGGADRFDVSLDDGSFITTLGVGARGIVAQSVQAGGGVANGFELLERASAGESTTVTREISILGANVSPDEVPEAASFVADGDIQTYGADADAVVVQAIGGGGGVIGSAGGASWTLDEANGKKIPPQPAANTPDPNAYKMRIDLGQSSPEIGMQNLHVVTELGGWIRTWGDHAEAAIVQSISGGGGVAGLSHDPTSDSMASVSIRVGASGATSAGAADRQKVQGVDQTAAAGGLDVTLSGSTFFTNGWGANGAVIQEIQGGGGIAAVGSTTVRATTGSGRTGLLVGGDYGGTFGSAALSATMGDDALIQTGGDGAIGLLVQNVVGGGGVGALGTSQPLAVSNREGVVEMRLGGSNGTGQANRNGDAIADPGDLTLDIGEATLVTGGAGSTAALVQSVGGGGGLALTPAPWLSRVTLGASGGGSSYGGAVAVEMGVDPAGATRVQTAGDAARGVVVQSISGGGGQASAPNGRDGWSGGVLPVQLGATGATGGWNADVAMTFGGGIATSGDYADGLVVQSIAGGGGLADIGDGAGAGPRASLTLGQTQGGGRAGKASLTHTGRGVGGGSIDTEGAGAYGVLVQSIGGGGGAASFGHSADGAVLTLGATSAGDDDRGAGKAQILREYAGEGPTGAETSSLARVVTRGDDAHALAAQSIAGGGGVARIGGAQKNVTLQLGGRGGEGADRADDVNVGFYGRLVTVGDRAIGIVAQSISGGGGIASAGSGSVSEVRLGGLEGYRGTAGAGSVDVTLGGPQGCSLTALDTCATTYGEGAHGIVAQSIAGGGGIGGDVSLADGLTLIYSRSVGYAPSTIEQMNGEGDAGYVGVNVDRPLVTYGDGAYGVIAQSLGGGGGLGGDAQGPFAGLNTNGDVGRGGAIDFIMQPEAAVIANGRNSTAVFLQSLGAANGRGMQDVWIDAFINGYVQGGSGPSAYGLLMHGGGAENAITVFQGATITALSGEAIRYITRNDPYDSHLSIRNAGVIDGNVSFKKGRVEGGVDGSAFGPRGVRTPGGAAASLAAGPEVLAVRPAPPPAITLVNRRGGVLRGAERYDADVLNRGLLVAGDPGDHADLVIAGDFEQGSSGTLAVDAEPLKGRGDVIRVAGDATLDGALSLAPRALIGGAEHRVMEVGGDIFGAFDRLGGAIFRFEQRIENGGVTLRATGVELASGLGGQEAEAARYLERLFLTGDRDFARLFGKLELAAQGGALGSALSGATLGATMAGEAATFELTRDRFDTLLGCGETGGRSVDWETGGLGGYLTLLGSGRHLDQDASGAAAGYEGDAWTAGFATTLEVAPGWLVSGALGWETLNLARQGGGGSVEGTTGFLGAAVTRERGALSLSGAATAGWSEFDSRRFAGPLAPGQARSEHGALSLGLRARAAWTQALEGGAWLKPSLDLDLIHVSSQGFTETGAGRQALRVSDAAATAFVVTPSLEAGLRRELGESGGDPLGLRAWARAGVSFSTLDSYDADVRFARDATGIAGFANGAAQAQAVGRLGLGVALEVGDRADVGVSYEGAAGDGYAGQAGRLSVNVRF